MSKPLPYYPFYVQDFDESTVVMEMSLDEVGLYVLALNESWKRGAIPADLKALALRIRRPFSAVKKAWPKVAVRWEPNGTPGYLVNPRQEIERTRAIEKSEQARKNVLRRYVGSTDVSAKEDTDEQTGALPRASESVSSSGVVVDLSKKKSRTSLLSEKQAGWFSAAWAVYWRRIARGDAEKSFASAVTTEEQFSKVMQALELQSPWMLQRDSDKRPYFATWLNQKRWEDDPDVQQTLDSKSRVELSRHNVLIASLERR